MTTKEEFLLEHNRLSPASLAATKELLTRFRTEKASVFKDNDWSVEKLRRPFIIWLTSLSPQEKEEIKSMESQSVSQQKVVATSASFSSYPRKRGISARGESLNKDQVIPATRRF